MRKRDWLYVISALAITWGLDRITKMWASGLAGVVQKGPLSFVLHHNHGAMLGLFTDLPGVLRIVTLSTGGAVILCSYALIQYLLPIKSMKLRIGLSILVGGILGNVADRILWGYVVDFIVLGNPTLSSPAFNVADALQWVGYALIVWAIVRDGEILWPENDVRRRYWINRKFQLRYSFLLMAIGLCLAMISLVFSYTYLRVTIAELVGNNQYLINKFVIPFIVTFSIICVGFCGILFALGKYFSHRIAGPVYAFERFVHDIMEGKDRPLKLRAGDEFKYLEEVSEQLRERMRQLSPPTVTPPPTTDQSQPPE